MHKKDIAHNILVESNAREESELVGHIPMQRTLSSEITMAVHLPKDPTRSFLALLKARRLTYPVSVCVFVMDTLAFCV